MKLKLAIDDFNIRNPIHQSTYDGIQLRSLCFHNFSAYIDKIKTFPTGLKYEIFFKKMYWSNEKEISTIEICENLISLANSKHILKEIIILNLKIKKINKNSIIILYDGNLNKLLETLSYPYFTPTHKKHFSRYMLSTKNQTTLCFSRLDDSILNCADPEKIHIYKTDIWGQIKNSQT